MSNKPMLATVLGHYAIASEVRQITPIVSEQSFSGAQLWRLTTPHSDFLLRRWPEESDGARIAFIQHFLRQIGPLLTGLIAVPQLTTQGASECFVEQHYWSLSPWLNGEAHRRSPVPCSKVENALQALARFHLAAANYQDEKQPLLSVYLAVPTGINQRYIKLKWWRTTATHRFQAFKNSPNHYVNKDLLHELERLFLVTAPAFEPEIQQATHLSVPVQICLRDVWRAHILFQDDEVTGIIDYDALQMDSVATDIARLLGSMAGDEMNLWAAGLVAYHKVRPLSEAERQLVVAYDRSAVLLTGLQWMEWIFLTQREFANPAAVTERLQENLTRLRHLRDTIRRDVWQG